MLCFKLSGGKVLAVIQGDITELRVDAIVNPANSLMIMGGGVAGAIKRRGGSSIEEEARSKAPVPVGEAVTTHAGKLPSKYVIHAPTMEAPAMKIGLGNVRMAMLAALKEASRVGVESLAIPALGAGVGGVRVYDAFREMARIAAGHGETKPKFIVFVAWGEDSYKEAVNAVREVLNSEGEECKLDL